MELIIKILNIKGTRRIGFRNFFDEVLFAANFDVEITHKYEHPRILVFEKSLDLFKIVFSLDTHIPK